MAEAMDLKSIQCGFESHSAYQYKMAIWDKIKGTRGRMSRSKALRNDPEDAILSCLRVFVDFEVK